MFRPEKERVLLSPNHKEILLGRWYFHAVHENVKMSIANIEMSEKKWLRSTIINLLQTKS